MPEIIPITVGRLHDLLSHRPDAVSNPSPKNRLSCGSVKEEERVLTWWPTRHDSMVHVVDDPRSTAARTSSRFLPRLPCE